MSFFDLTPDLVFNSLEQEGFRPTGFLIQLNSYENRVFDVALEDGSRVITKFYRPGRWNAETIQDEHDFALELKGEGVPAIAPLILPEGGTLREHHGMYMAVFPKALGRIPDEFPGDLLKQVGRRLAQIHNIGSRRPALHRHDMTSGSLGWPALEINLDWISMELRRRYEEAANTVLEVLDQELEPDSFIRIHGDCHRGNLLQNKDEFFFVDFDDFCNGPPVQDFWMLVGEKGDEGAREEDLILSGYEELREFDWSSFRLVEPLRALRLIHYSAWIAKRWEDPSFPKLFPEFNTYRYWLEEVEELEKIAIQL